MEEHGQARWYALSRELTPALESVVTKAGRCAAKIRDAQTAIAVERYRIANGALPSQLSDLVPAFLPSVPSDPFDGKPLRYQTLAKGYIYTAWAMIVKTTVVPRRTATGSVMFRARILLSLSSDNCLGKAGRLKGSSR